MDTASQQGGVQEDPDALAQKKIANMRSKLSLAKEMLEELLAERDEMDRTHSQEMGELQARLAAGKEERDALAAELVHIKEQIREVDAQNRTEEDRFNRSLAEVKEEEGRLREKIQAEKKAQLQLQQRIKAADETARRTGAPSKALESAAVSNDPTPNDNTLENHSGNECSTSKTPEPQIRSRTHDPVPDHQIDEASPPPTTQSASAVIAEEPGAGFGDVCEQAAESLMGSEHRVSSEASEHESSATAYTPISALKRRRPNRKGGRVSWGEVSVRGYAVELGGGGGIPLNGSPLGLGWSFEAEEPVAIDNWEAEREPVRIHKEFFMRQGYIPADQRHEKLRALGFEESELESTAEQVKEVQMLRKESVDELNEEEEMPVLANAFMWWWMVTQGLDSYLEE